MKMRKSFRYFFALCVTVMAVGMAMTLKVHAQEEGNTEESGSIRGSMMVTTEQVQARETPGLDAAVFMEFPEGTVLFVTSQDENGWSEIFYQGKTAYVQTESLMASEVIDVEALDAEMEKKAEEGAAWIESLEMQRKAIHRSRIWRIVIIVLIVAVFAAGVISALQRTKGKTGTGKKGKAL